MDLLIHKTISASQKEREGGSQVAGVEGEKPVGGNLEGSIRNRVITSLEFELQN